MKPDPFKVSSCGWVGWWVGGWVSEWVGGCVGGWVREEYNSVKPDLLKIF